MIKVHYQLALTYYDWVDFYSDSAKNQKTPTLNAPLFRLSNSLLNTPEMYIQLMKRRKERSHRRALRHLGESVDVFWEALAAVAELAVRAGYECVRVVDIT